MTMASSPITAVTLGSVAQMRQNIRRRSKLKGRQTDEQAMAELRALIGHGPHRRDLLIEHLHRLNDEYRGLHERHLVALAAEMAIPMAEVYEVATFYHHFEVLKGDAAAPALTVRVCEGLSCELAGAQALLARLPQMLGRDDIRIVAAPCVGRCEQAPVAIVHQNPVPCASLEAIAQAVADGAISHPDAAGSAAFDAAALAQHPVTDSSSQALIAPDYVGFQAYLAQGGYALAQAVAAGRHDPQTLITTMKTRACAAWAARVFRPGENGGSCAGKPAHG